MSTSSLLRSLPTHSTLPVDCLSAPDQTELIERSALIADRALAIVDDFFDALLTEKLETVNR
jgi:hypothetical protein